LGIDVSGHERSSVVFHSINRRSLLKKSVFAFSLLSALLALVFTGAALSDPGHGRIVVTPKNQHGWTTADTRPGGTVTFVADPSAPSGKGALQLTTDPTLTAKAQYLHDTNTPLASVTELSYWTRQISPPGPVADPSYQLALCLNGVTATGCAPQTAPGTGSSFTTLVYEPYQGGQGVVLPDVWQFWNIDSTGRFWSSRTVVCSNGGVVGTPGGPATYTIADIKAMCPNAVVVQFGVNIGTNNPGYVVRTDLFNFNGTVYDFEPAHGHHGDNGDDGDNAGEGGHGGGDHGDGGGDDDD
jgi:hypothetical protein